MKKIILFWGDGCPDCAKVMPWLDKLSKEFNIEFDMKEVWNDESNVKEREKYREIILEFCKDIDYVPCFVDIDKSKAICEPGSIEEMKDWLR